MKFMHIADVHLGVMPDKGKPWSEQRAQDIRDTFQRILDTAREEEIDVLLIAGDLFHFPPTMAMLKEVDARLSELEHVTTILIAGNHDYRAAGSPLDRYEFQMRRNNSCEFHIYKLCQYQIVHLIKRRLPKCQVTAPVQIIH